MRSSKDVFCKDAANTQEDTHAKCDFRNVANQPYWNHTSAWVLSCKFVKYLQKVCLDEHLWEITSAIFYSICLSNFSLKIRVKVRLFSNIFLTRWVSSAEGSVLHLPESYLFLFKVVPCEQYFVTFCWILFFQCGARLNCCWNAA